MAPSDCSDCSHEDNRKALWDEYSRLTAALIPCNLPCRVFATDSCLSIAGQTTGEGILRERRLIKVGYGHPEEGPCLRMRAQKKLRVVLPTSRLLPKSLELMSRWHKDASESLGDRTFLYCGVSVSVGLCKIQDAARLIEEGVADCGIVGEEWVMESNAQLIEISDLGWYRIRISPIVSGRSKARTIGEFLGVEDRLRTLVTPYPNIVLRALDDHLDKLRVITVHGSTEDLVPTFADLAVDCVETGDTIQKRGLRELAPLGQASVKMMASPRLAEDGCLFQLLFKLSTFAHN